MSRASEPLVFGAPPRVDLLPPEVRARIRGRSTRRLLTIVVVGVLLICVGSVVGAEFTAREAQATLAAEQQRTQNILAEQAKYSKVRTVKSEITLVQAAQRVGTATEIDWKKYIIDLGKTLPTGVSVSTVTVDSGSVTQAYEQPTVPLQGPRVATVTLAATSSTLAAVPEWLDALPQLPGYVDAMPGATTLANGTAVSTGGDSAGTGSGQDASAGASGTGSSAQSGPYSLTVVMHVDQNAYTHRFAQPAGDTSGKDQ